MATRCLAGWGEEACWRELGSWESARQRRTGEGHTSCILIRKNVGAPTVVMATGCPQGSTVSGCRFQPAGRGQLPTSTPNGIDGCRIGPWPGDTAIRNRRLLRVLRFG